MDFLAVDFSKLLKYEPDGGDTIDELNYHWTSLILFIIGLSNLGMMYIARPIQCWAPPEFPSQWESYSELYCFFGTNTYYYPDKECESAGKDDEVCINKYRESAKFAYYPWVPLLIFVQAACFAAPCIFWRTCDGLTCNNILVTLNP